MYKKSTSALGTTDSNNSVSLKACGYADLFLNFSTKNSKRFLLILKSAIIDKPVQVKNIHRVFINPSNLNLIQGRNLFTVVCLAFILQTVSWGKPVGGGVKLSQGHLLKKLRMLEQMATRLRFEFLVTDSL